MGFATADFTTHRMQFGALLRLDLRNSRGAALMTLVTWRTHLPTFRLGCAFCRLSLSCELSWRSSGSIR